MVEVFNKTRTRIAKGFLVTIVEEVLMVERKKDYTVEVVIVGEARIRTLNRQWRRKDKVTDVLSFGFGEGGKMNLPRDNYLGEIYICFPQAVRQAKDYHASTEEELKRLLIHGLLHLLGYDHILKQDKIKMEQKERKLAYVRKS